MTLDLFVTTPLREQGRGDGSVEQHVEQEILQADSLISDPGGEIPVENPATGETVATVPDLSAEAVAEMVARGAGGAARVGGDRIRRPRRDLPRAQKWLIANADRVVETIVSENGKTREDAQLEEIVYAPNAFGFWAKKAPKYLADESVKSQSLLALGKKVVVRYSPLGVIGVIGPWNYPLTNHFGDCIPALMAGNAWSSSRPRSRR